MIFCYHSEIIQLLISADFWTGSAPYTKFFVNFMLHITIYHIIFECTLCVSLRCLTFKILVNCIYYLKCLQYVLAASFAMEMTVFIKLRYVSDEEIIYCLNSTDKLITQNQIIRRLLGDRLIL